MKLTLYEIADVVGAQNDITDYPDTDLHHIEFDSRKIIAGDLFLPLKGARDGHDFIPLAFENGAVATFSEKTVPFPHILVEDNLVAFQQLASYYLEKMTVEVIAVTGSNGKTTTKDMIAHILSSTYPTYKTQGNYNNEIGLPYTVLHMPDETEKIVLEMGQDHLGDIHLLSQIAKPNIAVVTLIGEAHLEFFGSRKKIAQGKLQIADTMPDDGILIVPDDDIITPYLPEKQKIIKFGQDIFITDLIEKKNSLTFRTNFLAQALTIPLPGKYNATNAMLASYVAKLCLVPENAIKERLRTLTLTNNRTEWRAASNGAEILSDVYNANPTAMRLILETFANIPRNPHGKKIVVLADMKELGETEHQLHAQMKSAISREIDQIFLYGPLMSALANAMMGDSRVLYYPEATDFSRLTSDVKSCLTPEDQILLKGSNSMKLADLVEKL